MALRTLQQNQRLHTLLAEASLTNEKEALALQFSNGRTARTSQLYTQECAELIQHLEAGLGHVAAAPTIDQEVGSDKMRRKILSLAHELRWEVTGTGKVDMPRLNAWCQSKGFGKKVLNQYTYAELQKLVSQLQIVHTKFLKGLEG